MATRLGLIGDTQGRYSVDALLARAATIFRDVDEIWHAGDWEYEEVLDGLAKLKPLTVVNGNAPDDGRKPARVVREIETLRVGMVHRPPQPGDEWLRGLDICIHGHTHVWRDEVVERVRVINVSTATGLFGREKSGGILTLDAGRSDLEKVLFG